VRLRDLLQQGVGPAEAARELGKTPSAIAYTHRRLIAMGQAPRRVRPTWRPWTKADIDELRRQVDLGYSYDRIAHAMKRTRAAIVLKSKRLHSRLSHSNNTLCARDVAQLLGKKCSKSVSQWIRRRYLKGRNAGSKEKPLWRIQWDDLLAFMENPDHWLLWDAARVTGDRAFVEWAHELRANEGRWLTQAEVAARYCVGVEAVGQWIRKGWLRARRIGYGNRVIAESALIGFVPLCQRPKRWPRVGWEVIGQCMGVQLRRWRPSQEV
jgi:hypothetical protein